MDEGDIKYVTFGEIHEGMETTKGLIKLTKFVKMCQTLKSINDTCIFLFLLLVEINTNLYSPAN